MSIIVDEVKRGKGRPNKYGKNDSDKAAIARDVNNFATLTPYYQMKLIHMGFIEIVQTQKGKDLVAENL